MDASLNFNLKKAAEAQRRLASRVVLKRDVQKPTFIAGADFSYHKQDRLIGAIVVVQKLPDFEIIEVAKEIREVKIPYIPGYLNFLTMIAGWPVLI